MCGLTVLQQMSGNNIIPHESKIYLNKPYVQLFWNPIDHILTNRWTGFCTSEEILAVGNRILDAVAFEKAQKVLYDAKQIEMLDESSQKYISGNFAYEMVGAGVKFAATVFPEDVLAKFSINDIQKKLGKFNTSSTINFFNSVNGAYNWLKTQ